MKKAKIFALLTLILFSITSAIGQENATHLKFKGVPIDGTLSSFVSKMKQQGFTHIEDINSGTAIMTGRFAGYNECYIFIYANQKGNVNTVAVFFPDEKTWLGLYANYMDIKSMLIKKYGAPVKDEEKWESHSEPRDDNDRMYEVKMNRCKFKTLFTLDSGIISLSINTIDHIYCKVGLLYIDNINSLEEKESAIEDL